MATTSHRVARPWALFILWEIRSCCSFATVTPFVEFGSDLQSSVPKTASLLYAELDDQGDPYTVSSIPLSSSLAPKVFPNDFSWYKEPQPAYTHTFTKDPDWWMTTPTGIVDQDTLQPPPERIESESSSSIDVNWYKDESGASNAHDKDWWKTSPVGLVDLSAPSSTGSNALKQPALTTYPDDLGWYKETEPSHVQASQKGPDWMSSSQGLPSLDETSNAETLEWEQRAYELESSMASISEALEWKQRALAVEEDWTAHVSSAHDGAPRVYYYNVQSKESLWEKPTMSFPDVVIPGESSMTVSNLLARDGDWSLYGTTEGADGGAPSFFYYNRKTGASQWEQPFGLFGDANEAVNEQPLVDLNGIRDVPTQKESSRQKEVASVSFPATSEGIESLKAPLTQKPPKKSSKEVPTKSSKEAEQSSLEKLKSVSWKSRNGQKESRIQVTQDNLPYFVELKVMNTVESRRRAPRMPRTAWQTWVDWSEDNKRVHAATKPEQSGYGWLDLFVSVQEYTPKPKCEHCGREH